jgi:carboxymethylenebutenolidase
VIAPAIFDREAPGLDLGYSEADIAEAMRLVRSHPVERTLADAVGCVEVLGEAGPVFMTGYCYGGSVAWLAACSDAGLAAAACYYGSMIPSRASLVPRCPTLVHFGRDDVEIPLESVEAFRVARPEVDVRLYPAGHGFNSDRRADHHAESADLAFARTLELFDACSAQA